MRTCTCMICLETYCKDVKLYALTNENLGSLSQLEENKRKGRYLPYNNLYRG